MTMKPICETVDQASEVFVTDCVSITSAPTIAVSPPIATRGGEQERREQQKVREAHEQEPPPR